jgi:hypothetical protein
MTGINVVWLSVCGLLVDQDIAEPGEWSCTNDLNTEAVTIRSTEPLLRRRSEPPEESGMKHTGRGFDVGVVASGIV